MINNIKSKVRKRNRKLRKRLKSNAPSRDGTGLHQGKIRYELSDRIHALHCGGIGLLQEVIEKSGLFELVDERIRLLKIRRQYHESDHVKNLIYNVLCGGECLDDLKMLRNNGSYLDALNLSRIPDATTAGDFLRRFGHDDNLAFLDVMNEANGRIWKISAGGKMMPRAVLDIDSSVTQTFGENKERMDISYNGKWGFHPLIVTEAETGVHVCLVNRSGNTASQDDAARWIEYSVAVVEEHFEKIYLRGDSAFSLMNKFDEWDDAGIQFCFGTDNTANMREKAEKLPKSRWRLVQPKKKAARIPHKTAKERQVEKRGFKNLHTEKEFVAEFEYKPFGQYGNYRIIVLKKEIRVTKGQGLLFDQIRYLFYITNIRDMSPLEVLGFIRKRCDHENKIEQLKNGVPALNSPCSDFHANWAWMIVGACAWNVKSWTGALFSDGARGREIVRMEFKRFLFSLVFIPCQILKTGRRIVYRFLNANSWFADSMLTIRSIRAIPLLT